MSPVSISLVLLFALHICQSQSALIPNGFACTNDKPRSNNPIYSTPPAGFVKVDLIHIFCGQIHKSHVSGFHARPGGADPPSASTIGLNPTKKPANQNDFAEYQKPKVYDSIKKKYVAKKTKSGIWPTSMTMETIVKAITYMARTCGGATPISKQLCIKDFRVNNGPQFDVVIIIKGGTTARTAYPVPKGTCGTKNYVPAKNWKICPYLWMGEICPWMLW